VIPWFQAFAFSNSLNLYRYTPALRRVRKTDNNRIARATGACIVHRVEELKVGLYKSNPVDP
jgi:hypothetical protein